MTRPETLDERVASDILEGVLEGRYDSYASAVDAHEGEIIDHLAYSEGDLYKIDVYGDEVVLRVEDFRTSFEEIEENQTLSELIEQ